MVDFSDTPEQAAWRQVVADFVEAALPAKLRDDAKYSALGGPGSCPVWPDPKEHDRAVDEFRDALIERGWAAPAWPQQYGGAELPVDEQFILNEVLAEYRAPKAGVLDVGSTIMVHASDELKQRFLPGFVEGKDKWAQGYSEPGSGSGPRFAADARRPGRRRLRDQRPEDLDLERARCGLDVRALPARTPDAPKHRGITYLLLEMNTPGVSVRPLEQINGRNEFNEVFFEDVRVPVDQAVGEINRGWYVGATHLDFERSSIGSALTMLQTLDDLFELIETEAGQPAPRVDAQRSPTLRGEIADRYTEANVARLFSYRVISMQLRDEVPNYEASMQKLFTDQLVQAIARTAMKTLGLYAPLWDGDDERTVLRAKWSRGYLGAVATTVGGGTSEIQRNIIATRGLGLPRG